MISCIVQEITAISSLSVPLLVIFFFLIDFLSNDVQYGCFHFFDFGVFSICHFCIVNMGISVKIFSGTAPLWNVKFSSNIMNDKLHCVINNQSSPAYQSLYLFIFLSL